MSFNLLNNNRRIINSASFATHLFLDLYCRRADKNSSYVLMPFGVSVSVTQRILNTGTVNTHVESDC
jgi:hypothetical protein